ncbi:MAG: hypothetical protein ACJAYC_000242 [Halieaceae bacterium]|jgi:hypothetical protein
MSKDLNFHDEFSIETRRDRYPRLITISHKITNMLGKQFPGAVPLIFVSGFPRSGTTWCAQVLADYFQLPFPQLSALPLGFPAILHGHEPITLKNRYAVYVVRDGRDVMVSLYLHFYKRYSAHDGGIWKKKFAHMFPAGASRENMREMLPVFIEANMTKPRASKLSWPDHVSRYFELESARYPLVKFEDMLATGANTLSDTITSLSGAPAEQSRIERTLQKYSFESQKNFKPDESNKGSGIAGGWLEYFSAESAEIFGFYANDQLIRLGYEESSDWSSLCVSL